MSLVRFGSGDPGRIAAQVVTGIGFLGAGVILRRGSSVRGLTTAATVWVVAGIGISVGSSPRGAILATAATVLCLAILTVVKRLEERVHQNSREASLSVTVPRHHGAVAEVINAVTQAGAHILDFEVAEEDSQTQRTLLVRVGFPSGMTRDDLSSQMAERLPNLAITWE